MNHLAGEKSPYLLQHAANPVDWHPWGEAAFALARSSGKPIFLSVGYATCHWCHVMAHESFENAQIAALLNEHFVAIKVDREERPDVDRVHMRFVQATTGGGGWPMSVWLTPTLDPIYGGTYFPPVSRWGRPGFAEVLGEIARLWREERASLAASAAENGARLAEAETPGGAAVPGAGALEAAVAEFAGAFDEHFAGFGGAPKFPRPAELFFLLHEARRTGDEHPRRMALRTLRAMADGGLRDHVGGGFHRYSVDAQWRVPHFEKMLYDQAQIALAYLEAAWGGEPAFLEVAEETLRYLQREMTDEGGGFCSAEDADSLPPGAEPGSHGAEGAFYLWSEEELDRLLGDDSSIVKARFGVRAEGNALQDPQGEFAGRNILYTALGVEALAERFDRPAAEIERVLARARRTMFEARASRPRPLRDDKVLTAWNGLAIAAFARASRVVRAMKGEAGEQAAVGYLGSARRAAAFIRERMWDERSGRLLRRYRDGESAIDAFAEDYASLIFGLLELFDADGRREWFDWATRLQARQDELFWDEETGGWFSTSGADPAVRPRLKEDYDGAEPAASSLGVLNLLRLDRLAGAHAMGERIGKTLRLFAPRLEGTPRAVPMMLTALSEYHGDEPRSSLG